MTSGEGGAFGACALAFTVGALLEAAILARGLAWNAWLRALGAGAIGIVVGLMPGRGHHVYDQRFHFLLAGIGFALGFAAVLRRELMRPLRLAMALTLTIVNAYFVAESLRTHTAFGVVWGLLSLGPTWEVIRLAARGGGAPVGDRPFLHAWTLAAIAVLGIASFPGEGFGKLLGAEWSAHGPWLAATAGMVAVLVAVNASSVVDFLWPFPGKYESWTARSEHRRELGEALGREFEDAPGAPWLAAAPAIVFAVALLANFAEHFASAATATRLALLTLPFVNEAFAERRPGRATPSR